VSLASIFQVREARFFRIFYKSAYFQLCLVFIWLVCYCGCMECFERLFGMNYSLMHVRTVVRSCIFAQASLSRLVENNRTLLWFLLELSLRRRTFVLSENSWDPVVSRFVSSSGERPHL